MCRKLVFLTSIVLALALVGTNPLLGDTVIERSIAAGTDDAEEDLNPSKLGEVDATSSDLELAFEDAGMGDPQFVALRFTDIVIPAGSSITEAWVRFDVDETKGGTLPVNLLIEGELSLNPAGWPADTGPGNFGISSRPRTTVNVAWSVPNWETTHEHGSNQTTTNIAAVIHEIIGQPGWASGDALVLIFRDDPANPSTGIRGAESFEGAGTNVDQIPLLHVEFEEAPAVEPDTLSGLADVTVVDGAIVSLRHEGTEYVVADGDLILGVTTRWYIVDGVETLWVDGDPAPAATVPTASNPKVGDIGAKADNFLFTLNGSTNISSIDGIDFQQTIFPFLTDTFFVFERGGNDAGSYQAILADGSLAAPVPIVGASAGGPYANTGVSVNNQNAFGVVFKTGMLVQGVRINAPGHDTLSISTPLPAPVEPGTETLVAYYAFENDANDASGNALHGTLIGDPNFVEGLAGYGMALDFDGIDDVVELGKFDVFGHITLAAWIRPESFAINDARIISKAKEWGANDHWWMLSTVASGGNYVPRFRLKTDESDTVPTLIGAAGILAAGEWSHVTAAWDGAAMILYLDGVEVGRMAKGGSAVAVDPNISVAIGSQPSDAFAPATPSHVVKFFDGLIDEVRIYHGALLMDEIRYLAGFRAPLDPGIEALAAYYALDNDANDLSGNNNHGTLLGEPQWVAGKISGALQFDGVDDSVDCGNGPSLDITGPITIAAWIYPTGNGSSNFPRIVDKSNGTGGADPGYKIYLRSADNYVLTLSAGGTFLNSTLAANLNAWNYVAFITDGTQRKLFLNGDWQRWDESAVASSSTRPLFIGNSPAGARHFQGIIDEVVIYNRALSEPEVRFIAGER